MVVPFFLFLLITYFLHIYAKTTLFNSPTALFNTAVLSSSAGGPSPGDTLVLADGVYYDLSPTDYSGGCMAGTGASQTGDGGGWCINYATNVTIRSQTPGGVIWMPQTENGLYISIASNNNTLTGFQFRNAIAAWYGVLINVGGSYNTISNVYMYNVSASHYIKFNTGSQYNVLTNSNFEYKPAYGPCPTSTTNIYCPKGTTWYSGNLIAIGVTPSYPGYHKIRYCSFYNMPNSPMTGRLIANRLTSYCYNQS